jgi:uncharacterized protein YlxW (UPF0749 family)
MFFWEAIMGKGKRGKEMVSAPVGGGRIEELETEVESLHERVGDLLVEIEDLEAEVRDLEAEVVGTKVAAFDLVTAMFEE